MIKELKYTGLTNAPDDYNCADGDLAAVVNLVNENGNLKPFVHPETIMTIQGVLCCVHKGSNYENYITLDEGNLYSQTKTGDRVLIIDNVGDVSKIEVIGNTLIVISNQPIKYILYKDQAYKYLGEKPPMPDMSFRFTGAFKEIPTNTNFSNKVKALVPNPPDNGSSPIAPENVASLTNLVFGHLNPKIAALIDNNKCPFPFFIRYALRLYDGTVTQHSAPIFCRETVLTMPYEYRRLKRKCEEYVGLTLSSWDKEWGEFLNDFSLSLRWGGYNGLWTDIVKSIDIFMSEQIYTYDQSGEIKKVISRTETIGIGVTINNIYLDIAYHDDKKIDKDISETGRFYKIYSIPTSGIFPDFKNQDVSRPYTTDDFNSLLPKGVIKNLQLQELMEDEYRSHHSLSAATSYVYNNRLHLANITQRIFKGFDLNEMSILNSRYIWEKWGDGFIDICLKINGDTVIKRQEINFDSLRSAYVYYPDSRAYEIRIYKNNTAVTPNWHVYYTIPLKSHPYLNGSYYLEPNLGGIIDNIKSITGTITIPPEPPGVDNVSRAC